MTDHTYGPLELAIDEIKTLTSLDVLSKGPVAVRLWFSLEFKMTGEVPRYATMPVSADKRLASEARQSRAAFDFAKWIAVDRIRAGIPLPPDLAELIADWMDGSWEPPKKLPGPSVAKNWKRDFIIRSVLHRLLEEHGIKPTKNQSPANRSEALSQERDQRSGAEILEEALWRTGFNPLGSARIGNIATEKASIERHDKMRGFLLNDEFENLEPEERI
jgi:hypothetical protein